MKIRRTKLVSSLVISAGFLIIILLPAFQAVLRVWPERELGEKRQPREFPRWEWSAEALDAWPRRFEEAFNDRFPLRSHLVQMHSYLSYFGLGASPSVNVVVGREGWLYFTPTLDEYRGTSLLPQDYLDRWIAEFEAKQALLASRGIRYLIVIPPNKEAIYPDFLPRTVRQHHNRPYTKQLLKRIPADSPLEILDLRKPLRELRNRGRLYHRTDTHWNDLGGAMAANIIVARLQEFLPDLPLPVAENSSLVYGSSPGGDLSSMINLQTVITEEVIQVKGFSAVPPTGVSRHPFSRERMKLIDDVLVLESGAKNQYTAILSGDSFSLALRPWLSRSFHRLVSVRPFLPYQSVFQNEIPAMLDAEKPDVYIEEVLDRNLTLPPDALTPRK